MAINKIFENKERTIIERKIKYFLNNHLDFNKIECPWAIGNLLADNFDKILGNLSSHYSSDFARRAMADLAFEDKDGNYYVVDVKTHRLDSKFNMPNLTSVERLARFYENDKNYFIVLKADYKIKNTKVIIKKINFIPIEFLDWDCLTLGALGWGQIQIANSNNVHINAKNSRKKWMLELCDYLFEFYPREVVKINVRLNYFRRIQKYWQNKKD